MRVCDFCQKPMSAWTVIKTPKTELELCDWCDIYKTKEDMLEARKLQGYDMTEYENERLKGMKEHKTLQDNK